MMESVVRLCLASSTLAEDKASQLDVEVEGVHLSNVLVDGTAVVNTITQIAWKVLGLTILQQNKMTDQ